MKEQKRFIIRKPIVKFPDGTGGYMLVFEGKIKRACKYYTPECIECENPLLPKTWVWGWEEIIVGKTLFKMYAHNPKLLRKKLSVQGFYYCCYNCAYNSYLKYGREKQLKQKYGEITNEQ